MFTCIYMYPRKTNKQTKTIDDRILSCLASFFWKLQHWHPPEAWICQCRGRRSHKQPAGRVGSASDRSRDALSCLTPLSCVPPGSCQHIVNEPLWGSPCRWSSCHSDEDAICSLSCARRWRSRMAGILLWLIRGPGEQSGTRGYGVTSLVAVFLSSANVCIKAFSDPDQVEQQRRGCGCFRRKARGCVRGLPCPVATFVWGGAAGMKWELEQTGLSVRFVSDGGFFYFLFFWNNAFFQMALTMLIS